GIEHYAGGTYHQLGRIAEEQRDFGAAEEWYRKSLAIKEKLGDEHFAASTYGELGLLAGRQGNFLDCGQWLIKCMLAFIRTKDQHLAAQTVRNFTIFYKKASSEDQEKLKAMWQEAGLGEIPQT